MRTTRRRFVQGTLATTALSALPRKTQAQPSRNRTIRAVMQGDLRSLDPIWTTANITAYHGAMIYDTLFALDGEQRTQPQMVGKFGVSDDKLTHTFELRDDLKFHDGAAVTADDVVASIRRWAVRDGAAQHLFRRVTDTPIKDEKTFQIVLKEPYGLVLEGLGKLETNLPVIMRKKDAETDANQQVTTKVGSGAFMFNERETRSGQRYVYDRNPNYVPRSEPASGMAGGKIAKVDRVIMENMADQQTAVAALKAGEIDFYETPPIDLLDQLETGRSRPGTNQLVVEWMDEGQAAIALELARAPKRLDARCAVQHDFGFIFTTRGNLGRRCRSRHDHGRLDADRTRSPRHRLRVIARRHRDDAARAGCVIELAQLVECSARLERSSFLEVLALEKQSDTGGIANPS
jgi:ABC-type transport system substrate-binding protein